MSNGQPIVQLSRLTKRFGRTVAVNKISLDLFGGEILGLTGPNGSGKSTLMSMLSGGASPDSGDIVLRGVRVNFDHPADAIATGIRSLSQSAAMFPFQNAIENIFIGQELSYRVLGLRLMAWSEMEAECLKLLALVGSTDINPQALVGQLSGGQQQAVALARMLACRGDVLVFDEPSVSLGVRQKEQLLEILRARASEGCSVVLISHDLDEVLRVCHRVVVLRAGRVVSDRPRNAITRKTLALELSQS